MKESSAKQSHHVKQKPKALIIVQKDFDFSHLSLFSYLFIYSLSYYKLGTKHFNCVPEKIPQWLIYLRLFYGNSQYFCSTYCVPGTVFIVTCQMGLIFYLLSFADEQVEAWEDVTCSDLALNIPTVSHDLVERDPKGWLCPRCLSRLVAA